ncbi:hypothetical protein K435DRAFT_876129 [Dendrothele bispora CBS 962.96]|uniref:Uncharacterized protein n=1 Tax=Dendrothele bispora (strain CBS 962.96) TaxID=1314807 RepID=A0A4S8KSV5_DENBC|nr:hypothetical protein K435DRAFT_876129 [Dendrothele bispora CBS 962.96]
MALLILLDDDPSKISITISLLNRLQVSQVETFFCKYRIRTVSINHDTPKSNDWWRNHVHDLRHKTSQISTARHLILLRDKSFQTRIKHINIDEARMILFASSGRFGLNAFPPAWGRFGELKLLLPKGVLFHCYTGTCPPHVQKSVEDACLHSDYGLIKTSVNRSNTVYARHCVVRSLEVLENDRCFI